MMNDELKLKLCRVCLQPEKGERFLRLNDSQRKLLSRLIKIRDVEFDKNLICAECMKDVNTVNELRKKLIKADQYFTDLCQPQMIKNNVLRRLKREHSKEETSRQQTNQQNFFCSKCFKSFSDSRYLEKHEYFKHTQIPIEDLFVCDHCGHKTKTKQLVRNHINTVHSTSPKEKFICRVCGKMLSTKGNLDGHEKTHIDIDPSDYVKCTVCTKTFKSKRFMLEHRKLVHDKSKVVPCKHCSHVSTCKGAHKVHFKSVHLKLKDFICSDCGLGFCTNSQLTRHFRIHSGERPYDCTYCSKPFRLSTHRNRHEKICQKRMNV